MNRYERITNIQNMQSNSKKNTPGKEVHVMYHSPTLYNPACTEYKHAHISKGGGAKSIQC